MRLSAETNSKDYHDISRYIKLKINEQLADNVISLDTERMEVEEHLKYNGWGSNLPIQYRFVDTIELDYSEVPEAILRDFVNRNFRVFSLYLKECNE